MTPSVRHIHVVILQHKILLYVAFQLTKGEVEVGAGYNGGGEGRLKPAC